MKLRTLGISLIWLLLAGGLFYFFDAKVHPNTADKLSGGAEVTLVRDLSGHYRAEAFINGVKTNVMVDTGATDVSISQEICRSVRHSKQCGDPYTNRKRRNSRIYDPPGKRKTGWDRSTQCCCNNRLRPGRRHAARHVFPKQDGRAFVQGNNDYPVYRQLNTAASFSISRERQLHIPPLSFIQDCV